MPNEHFTDTNLDEELEEEMERYLWGFAPDSTETFEKIPRRKDRDEN